MRIAIVDDELVFAKAFALRIKEILRQRLEELDIFTSGESFLSAENVYDYVFLDIEMPMMSGLELAGKIAGSTSVVFVTGRDELVYEAFNTTASVGFIRKSCLEQDLSAVAQRIMLLQQQEFSLTAKNGTALSRIQCADIVYIEKVSRNIVVHTKKESHSIRKSMTETEELLAPYGFVRTHVGYLVNIDYIELITPDGVVLSGNVRVPVSRQHIRNVKDMFLRRSVLLNE